MIPFWVRRLCSGIKKLDIVYRYRLYHNRLVVKYKTNLRRCYLFKDTYREHQNRVRIGPKDGLLEKPITIGHQFQWNPLSPQTDSDYFFVSKKVLQRSSLMQKEILMQELLYRIMQSGYIPCKYTNEEIQKSYDNLRTDESFLANGGYSLARKKVARPIIETYFDIKDMPRRPQKPELTMANAFIWHNVVKSALTRVINSKNDVSITTLTSALYRKNFGPSWPNPALYVHLFRGLGYDSNRVFYDPTPYLGPKAIACSIIGAKYAPVHPNFTSEFVNFLNIEMESLGDIDVLLLDNNFKNTPNNIDEYMAKPHKNAIIYVRDSDFVVVKDKYPTDKIIKINTAVNRFGYILIY